jgi:hypothetical protein
LNSDKYRKILYAAALLLSAAAVTVRITLTPSAADDPVSAGDTAEGISLIESISSQDVSVAEAELEAYRQQQMAAYLDSGNYAELYKNTLIMGDSHAEAFYSFGLLPKSMVPASIGKDVNNCDEDRAAVVKAQPKILFVNYGQNTIERCSGDVEKTVKYYREFLEKLQADIPNTKIVVCSVFTAQQAAFAKAPFLKNVPELNEELEKVCDEEGWQFIDTNSLLEDKYYEPDHIHTDKNFHRIWLNYVAIQSGLAG